MADQLAIEIFVDDRKASTTLAKFKAEAAKPIPINATVAQSFFDNLSAVERRTLSIRQELRNVANVTVGHAGLDGLGQAALRTQTQVTGIYTRLQQIEKEAATSREPAMLNKLQSEAAQLNAQLDRIETKMQRVAQGRANAPVRSNLNLGGGINAAAGLGVPLAGEAAAVADMAALLGISTSVLAVWTGIGVAGYAIVKATESIRKEAERRLKVEERIQIAINNQIISQKEALANFQKMRAEAANDRQFNDFLQGGSLEDLEKRRAALEKLASLGGSAGKSRGFDAKGNFLGFEESEETLRIRQQLLEVDKQIAEVRQKGNETDKQSAEERWEAWKRSQEAEREFEKERLENIEKQKKRIDELGKAYIEAFANIGVGSENPFVRLYNEGEQALKSFREQTQGLSKDLITQGEQLIKQQTDLARFRARVDASFEALDLRSQARNFRTAGNQQAADRAAAEAVFRQLTGIDPVTGRPSFAPFMNPNNLRAFFPDTSPATKLALFDFIGQQERSTGLFRNEQIQADIRRKLAEEDKPAQQRLDEQLRLANQLRNQADTEQKRADIDARIVGLSRGIDPNDLRPDQREAIATALENQAVRAEKREKDAETVNKDLLATNNKIREFLEELKKKAEEDPSKLLIEVTDKDGRVSNVTNGSPQDVALTYGGTVGL